MSRFGAELVPGNLSLRVLHCFWACETQNPPKGNFIPGFPQFPITSIPYGQCRFSGQAGGTSTDPHPHRQDYSIHTHSPSSLCPSMLSCSVFRPLLVMEENCQLSTSHS